MWQIRFFTKMLCLSHSHAAHICPTGEGRKGGWEFEGHGEFEGLRGCEGGAQGSRSGLEYLRGARRIGGALKYSLAGLAIGEKGDALSKIVEVMT